MLVLFVALFGAQAAKAQCEIQVQSSFEGCEPYNFKVVAKNNDPSKTVTYWDWNWGDGNGASGSDPLKYVSTDHIYKSRGQYQITLTVTYADGTKCSTQLATKVTVYGAPTAVIVIPSTTNLTQCYISNGVLNNFKFTSASQVSADGRPIVRYIWNFGDGDTSGQKNPSHTYDSSGTYVISLQVFDDKGCTHSVAYPTKIRVLRDIKADLTAAGSQGCISSVYTLKNITDTIGMNVKRFLWDYDNDGIWDDSTNWSGYQVTVTTGSQTAKLRLINRLGCEDDATFLMKNTIAKLKVWFKDTVCWEDAKKGVQFHAEEIQGATFYAWNFDDAPDPKNITPFVWEPVHEFVTNGPKNYSVKFHVDHPICGAFDTCVILHVMGPQATINLTSPPFSPNDYIPTRKRMPKVYFTLLNNGIAAFPGTCDSIPYAYFVPVTKTITRSTYCNAPYNKTIATIIYCAGTNTADTQNYVSRVTPTPTTTIRSVNDSVEVWDYYHSNDPLPTNPYFRSTGSQRFGPNMHDTNLYTCKMPNLVRFSNFSTKYRLYKVIDDNPIAAINDFKMWDIPTGDTLEPGTHALSVNMGWPYSHTEDWTMTVSKNTVINLLIDLLPPPPPLRLTNGWIDTCINKNFPYSSDSLRYFWDFGDGDKTCTTSVNNNDFNCAYSTLAAPYHYFKKAPQSGCATVQMWVYDDVMGCKDKATLQLRQSPPDAWWDRGVNGYDRMTWELQHQNAFKQATPEDETDAFPHLGLRLGIPNQKLNCTGSRYRFDIQANGQIMPTCGAQKYWVVFDSAATVIDTFCKVGAMKVKYRDYGFIGRDGAAAATAVRGISKGYPTGAPDDFWNNLPWQGRYWWFQGDTGCKTIGFVVKNGECYDTAWYHDYICFTRLSPQFSVTRIDTLVSYVNSDPVNGAITGKTVAYVPIGTSLDANEGHLGYRGSNKNINIPYRLSNRKREREGTDILLLPLDREMPRVKKFFYIMERREFPADEVFYYHAKKLGDLQTGLWPDSASLNPFRVKPLASDTDACKLWARTYNKDSVTSIQDTIYYTKYDLDHNLFTIRYDGNLNVTSDTNNIDGTRFFLLPKEYKALKKDGVFYLPYRDMRARPFGWKTPFGGIPIRYRTKVAGTVPVEDTAFFLDFTDPAKDDAKEYNDGNMRFALHDSVRMHVPFPGFYTIVSQAINADGCDVLASYNFIHGHFASFWIKGTDNDPLGDSIVCVNDTVHFLRKVRYWTTTCPPLPSGVIPEGCLAGPGSFDGFLPLGEGADIVLAQLYPWDFPDPVAHRQTLQPKYPKAMKAPSKPEYVEWNYGDDNAWYREGAPYGKFGEGGWKYKKPGIYDVTMRSYDSLGYSVFTSRRHLINVVQVDANFAVQPLRDTHSICAPKNIVYKDKTKLLGSDVDVFGKFYAEKTVIAKKGNSACYEVTTKTFLMDSIQAWTWSTGQKNQAPITRTETDSLVFDYRANGQYDVGLKVVTANREPRRCTDEEIKKKYIRIDGPRPSFELLDTSGCVPFIARVRNTSSISSNYVFYQGDGKEVKTGYDTIVKLRYLTPGRFKVTMIQQDTIFDPVLNRWVTCTSPEWPDPFVDTMEFWVTVYPFSPLVVKGDTVVCPNTPAKYTATSTYGEFIEWKWETNDGQKYNSQNKSDSSAIFSWSKPGNYQVYVKGKTEKNCEIADTIDVRVDSIKAIFTIDDKNAKKGQFVFINESQNGVRYEWTAKNINTGQSVAGFTETKNDRSQKPYEFSDLQPKDEKEAPDTSTTTDFKFEVCLIAYSPIGCPDTMCKEINFPRAFKPWNVITPDGDGHNDVFDPHIKGETSYEMQIFNRWGEKVFTSTSSDVDWNGKVNNTGADCPAGTYYYVWKFTLVGGVEKTLSGTVTVLRDKK
jgi:gliding motility-associated-like protein